MGPGSAPGRVAAKWALQWRLRSDPAPIVAASMVSMPRDRVKIAAVQWSADPVLRPREWSSRVESLFRQAAEAHCHLIVFPEYVALSLLGVMGVGEATTASLTDSTIATLMKAFSNPLEEHWSAWMTAMARRYRLVTHAGSCLALTPGGVVNQALVIDGQGRRALRQSKWHPLPEERRWGVQQGAMELPTILAPWGLASLICNDATYFESFRIVAHQGAQIACVPIADPDPRYTEGKARRGCFSAVQDVPMVGVVAASTGRLFGLRLTGKAGIYLPAPLTSDGSGIAGESPRPVGEGLVTAVVSLNQLRDYQAIHSAQHPVPPSDFMDALYQFEEGR